LTDRILILDLDETLLHSFVDDEDLVAIKRLQYFKDYPDLSRRAYYLDIDDVATPLGQGDNFRTWGITRPHLKEFLAFAFLYFRTVMVWTAGTRRYADSIVKEIFSGLPQPTLVYSRDECVISRDNHYTKPIAKIIEDEDLWDFMNLKNTLIIDDKDSNFIPNPENGIKIPAFSPKSYIDSLRSDDNAYAQIVEWLMEPNVINAFSVQHLDKSRIFDKIVMQPMWEKPEIKNQINERIKKLTRSNFDFPTISPAISPKYPAFVDENNDFGREVVINGITIPSIE